jgi:hypothetical protein
MSNLLQQFLLHRHLLLNNIFFPSSILSFFDTKPTTQAAAAAAALLYTWMYIYAIDEPTTSANSIVGHRAAENIL